MSRKRYTRGVTNGVTLQATRGATRSAPGTSGDGPAGVWTPARLALAAWWDPSDPSQVTESGGKVSQVNDKSGNGNHLIQGSSSPQPAIGSRTIGGLDVLDLDGSNDHMDLTTPISLIGKEAWSVCQIDNHNTNNKLFGGPSNTQVAIPNNTRSLRLWNGTLPWGSDTQSTREITAGIPYILGYRAHTTTKKFSINGDPEDTGDVYQSPDDLIITEMGKGQFSPHWDGLIGETIIVAQELTTPDREKLEGYFAWRYSQVEFLPAGHPYRNDGTIFGYGATIPFDPSYIPSVQAWFDPADPASITEVAGEVSQWNDKANGYNVVQPNNSNQPETGLETINGLNVLSFPSNSPADHFDGLDNVDYDEFVTIARSDGWTHGNRPTLLGGASSADYTFQINNTVIDDVADGWQGGNFYIDGNTTTSPNTEANDLRSRFMIVRRVTSENHKICIGADRGLNNRCWDGVVGDIVYFKGATDLERQRVEGYIAWKWNRVADLPLDHPYKYSAPLEIPFDPLSLDPFVLISSDTEALADGGSPAMEGELVAAIRNQAPLPNQKGGDFLSTATVSERPTYRSAEPSIEFDAFSDEIGLLWDAPDSGVMVLATNQGILISDFNIPGVGPVAISQKGIDSSGFGGGGSQGDGFIGIGLFPSATEEQKIKVRKWFESKGAVRAFEGSWLRRFYSLSYNTNIKQFILGASVQNMQEAFFNSTITGIEKFNARQVTSINRAWRQCDLLASFPEIELDACLDASFAWEDCSSLTSFPALSFPVCTTFSRTWYECTGLTSFPLISIPSATFLWSAWEGCTGLTGFPLIDTNNVTSVRRAWKNCSGLLSFPLLDLANVEEIYEAWEGCSSLTSFPAIDITGNTNSNGVLRTWKNCSGLTSFPALDYTAVPSFQEAWEGCTSMVTFAYTTGPGAAAGNFTRAWKNCSSMTTFPAGFFDNMGTAPFSSMFDEVFAGCTSLTAASVENIVNSIDASGISRPLLTDIDIDYDAGTGAPNIAAAVASLAGKNFQVILNGVAQ